MPLALSPFESDLFFNLDHDEAEAPREKPDVFAGYDPEKLMQQAMWFCDCLEGAGGRRLSAQAVVDDFNRRL